MDEAAWNTDGLVSVEPLVHVVRFSRFYLLYLWSTYHSMEVEEWSEIDVLLLFDGGEAKSCMNGLSAGRPPEAPPAGPSHQPGGRRGSLFRRESAH